jgi:hypothetical protein
MVVLACRSLRFGRIVGERGYASVLALGMLIGSVLLIGLATDVARLIVVWRETSHLAHTAAETGAGWVESQALYDGAQVIDVPAAISAAQAVAGGPGRSIATEADPTQICVTVQQTVSPGLTRLVGAGNQRTSVTACASPRQG